MGVEFTPTEADQIETVAAFLQRSFHAAEDAPFLNRALLHWKYYESGPSWRGSRSYVVRDGGQILAHAAIWPLQFASEGEFTPDQAFPIGHLAKSIAGSAFCW